MEGYVGKLADFPGDCFLPAVNTYVRCKVTAYQPPEFEGDSGWLKFAAVNRPLEGSVPCRLVEEAWFALDADASDSGSDEEGDDFLQTVPIDLETVDTEPAPVSNQFAGLNAKQRKEKEKKQTLEDLTKAWEEPLSDVRHSLPTFTVQPGISRKPALLEVQLRCSTCCLRPQCGRFL